MVKAIRELEDFIPELVAFTVDFFSALFVSACMTTSGSAILSVMFIVSDVAQGLLEFHEVRMNAKVIMNILHRDPKSKRTNSFEATDLIAMILRVARNPRGFRVTRIENVRLRACLPHPLTEEQEMRLQTLQASGIFGSGTLTGSRKRSIIRWLPSQFSTNASIYPEDTEASVRTASKDYSARSKRETAKKLVEQGLQLLFHCEYLALVEYVECIVPLIFVTYESILKQLPNAVYYPGSTDSWGMTAVMNLLAFSALEIGTFVLFVRFLQQKFAFSPLYQLAFVLETQVYLVQAKLLIEVVTLLQSKLAHFGGGYAANIDHKP
eukprot:jgi/Phyca11/124954/e_gw1.55.202.1